MDPSLARSLRVALLDVDGVLTTGHLAYDAGGGEGKGFHTRDGYAIKLAIRHGLGVGLVSGRRGGAVEQRARELGCEPRFLGVDDKVESVEGWLAERGLEWATIAFVGDDLADLGCMGRAGLGVAVADAAHEIRRHADLVLRRPGGRGAVAEFLLRLLRLRGLRLVGRELGLMHG